MGVGNRITATEFAAFLKCPTKGHLVGGGERAPGTFFTDIEARISSMYKAAVEQHTSIGASAKNSCIGTNFHQGATTRLSRITLIATQLPMTLSYRRAAPKSSHRKNHRHRHPMSLFCCHHGRSQVLPTASLCASVRSHCRRLPVYFQTQDILIYGDGPRRRNVKVGNHLTQTRQTIEAIRTLRRGREPPPLVLNRHCAICDFQQRCRNLAIERDELSLLSAMTVKERTKYAAKGVVYDNPTLVRLPTTAPEAYQT